MWLAKLIRGHSVSAGPALCECEAVLLQQYHSLMSESWPRCLGTSWHIQRVLPESKGSSEFGTASGAPGFWTGLPGVLGMSHVLS